MSGIVLKVPIVAGKVEAWRRFCQELAGSQRLMYEASRLRLGVTRERLALIETAFGSAAVISLEANDVARALSEILISDLPFDRWYLEQIQELHGFNLAQYEAFSQQEMPETHELVFEWSMPSDIAA